MAGSYGISQSSTNCPSKKASDNQQTASKIKALSMQVTYGKAAIDALKLLLQNDKSEGCTFNQIAKEIAVEKVKTRKVIAILKNSGIITRGNAEDSYCIPAYLRGSVSATLNQLSMDQQSYATNTFER
jgi:hypothetical protein